MQNTYVFGRNPEYKWATRQVLVDMDDFENIISMAENWLNLPNRGFSAISANQARPRSAQRPQPQNYPQIVVDNRGVREQVPESRIERPMSTTDGILARIATLSAILKSAVGQKLGKSPLDFLSKELSRFKAAKEIFATRSLLPRTYVAFEFHAACDSVENVVVIIKSGQYIAGGYTEVPFESPENYCFKPNPKGTTFVYSLNRRKVYALKNTDKALNCHKDCGPVFGESGVTVFDDISKHRGYDDLYRDNSSFYELNIAQGELFGEKFFEVDEYEVYKLE